MENYKKTALDRVDIDRDGRKCLLQQWTLRATDAEKIINIKEN